MKSRRQAIYLYCTGDVSKAWNVVQLRNKRGMIWPYQASMLHFKSGICSFAMFQRFQGALMAEIIVADETNTIDIVHQLLRQTAVTRSIHLVFLFSATGQLTALER